jgi:hypothetical protein
VNLPKPCLTILAATTVLPAAAFFDDFNGTALQPHWGGFSEGCLLNGGVAGGFLNITRVYAPGAPPETYCLAGYLAYIGEELHDFRMQASVMWDQGEYQDLYVGVTNGVVWPGLDIGHIRYKSRPGQGAIVEALSTGHAIASVPAGPPSQVHEFEIERVSGIATFKFNDIMILQAASPARSMQFITLLFGGPDTSQFAPLHVDSVQVVPEPNTLLALAMLVGLLWRHRC